MREASGNCSHTVFMCWVYEFERKNNLSRQNMPAGIKWLMLPFPVSTLSPHEAVNASRDTCPFPPLSRWWPGWGLGSWTWGGNFFWKCFPCWEARERWTGYQSGCKSVLCVLEPITKAFWASRTSFTRGAWQPLPSRVLHQKEDGEGVFRKLWNSGMRLWDSSFPSFRLRNCGFVSNWNTERLFDGRHSSLPSATHTLLAKTFWRNSGFHLNAEDQNSPQTKIKNPVVLFLNIQIW